MKSKYRLNKGTGDKQCDRTYDKTTGVVTWNTEAGFGDSSVYWYVGEAHQWVKGLTKIYRQCSVIETRGDRDFVEVDTRSLWSILRPLIDTARDAAQREAEQELYEEDECVTRVRY